MYIMIEGISGAGKSILAERISKDYGYHLLNPTLSYHHLYDVDNLSILHQYKLDLMFGIMKNKAKIYSGADYVIDDMFHPLIYYAYVDENRDWMVDYVKASLADALPKAIFLLQLPLEISQERIFKREMVRWNHLSVKSSIIDEDVKTCSHDYFIEIFDCVYVIDATKAPDEVYEEFNLIWKDIK